VTDFKHDVPVSYTGVLPDLFREGTGVVAHGKMSNNGTFVADEVLAKHDEKYMPPEVARSLKRRHGEAREEALSAPAPAGAPSAGMGGGQPNGAGAPAQSPSTTSNQQPRTPGEALAGRADAGAAQRRSLATLSHAPAQTEARHEGPGASADPLSARPAATNARTPPSTGDAVAAQRESSAGAASLASTANRSGGL